MTLRTKLALALTFAALLPMGVAVGLPMLQAGKRAREESSRRLEAVRRQAAILIGRREMDAASRVQQVAAELANNRASRQSLLEGPASAAHAVTRSLAERYGLDHLDIRNRQGTQLATSRAETGAAYEIDGSGFDDNRVLLHPLPAGLPGEEPPMAFFARRTVPLGRDTMTVSGGRVVDRGFIEGISEISGQPSSLLNESGEVVEAAGGTATAGPRIAGVVPLGDGGWRVRVSLPAGDARVVRRELLAAFTGVAPFAIAIALAVGILLAAGISRPIRALASRAEAIAAERAVGPLSLVHATNEVRRLTLSFDQMLDALLHSERQRGAAEQIAAWREVARRIAHEVKNPLSPIKVAVENIRRTRSQAPEEFERALEVETATILEEVESLRRLVDEFSLFARLPRPQPVPCDLGQIVTQSLALFAPRVEASGVRVEMDQEEHSGPVLADPEQIGRVFKNILTNALDALEPVADRRLSIALRRRTGFRGGSRSAFTEVEFRDSGVGFETDALRRVFEPYFTTRTERGGTGLGMAIAYRIVTEHGGTIQARGGPGRGASIIVRLPVDGPPAARA